MRQACKLTEKDYNKLGLDLRFAQGTFKKIHTDITTVITLLQSMDEITHTQILFTVEPILSKYYLTLLQSHSFDAFQTIKSMYPILSYTPLFSPLLPSSCYKQMDWFRFHKKFRMNP
jgi:hypothetical protein